MRHRVFGKKLNRDAGHRKALRRNLMIELVDHGEIITTEAKAKAMRGAMEKLITLAKRSLAQEEAHRVVHARRLVLARLGNNREAMAKIFDELAPRYESRPGGYTRVFKVGARQGDNAPLVMIQLVGNEK
jgi:large subunit ribosomal protein L17